MINCQQPMQQRIKAESQSLKIKLSALKVGYRCWLGARLASTDAA
jgi:hypothetical protein